MTVLTNTRRREYPGNGVTTVFSGPRIFLETQLAAYLVNQATGAVTTLTRGPDYTISSIGFPQSIVTLAVAPTAGLTLLLLRTLPSQQPYSIKNQGAFFADIHEDALDYRAMFDQQMEDALSLALRVPETTLNFDAILPQPGVGDSLRPVVLNPTGTGLEFGDFAAGDLLLRPNLASNSPAQGASLVAISDQDALFDASTVEGALAELANKTASNKPEDLQQVIRNMRDGLTEKVVCLGDSITYGQLDTGGQAATPYPARLQALLQA